MQCYNRILKANIKALIVYIILIIKRLQKPANVPPVYSTYRIGRKWTYSPEGFLWYLVFVPRAWISQMHLTRDRSIAQSILGSVLYPTLLTDIYLSRDNILSGFLTQLRGKWIMRLLGGREALQVKLFSNYSVFILGKVPFPVSWSVEYETH